MKQKEQILFYHFENQEQLEGAEKVAHRLGISTKLLPEDSWREKVGFLLGRKGFSPAKQNPADETFTFSDEVMILDHIKGKRLDALLKALSDADVPTIRYKSVITPFNVFWTLRRLCERMQKEHGALAENKGS